MVPPQAFLMEENLGLSHSENILRNKIVAEFM